MKQICVDRNWSKAQCFTLIELLVNTAISSLCFFKRGDKLEVQNTPLFLKEKGGAGERENFFSRGKYLHDPDNHDGVISHLELDILECEVKWALGSITMTKLVEVMEFQLSYFKS